jgi:hypothetical protein
MFVIGIGHYPCIEDDVWVIPNLSPPNLLGSMGVHHPIMRSKYDILSVTDNCRPTMQP